MQPPSLNNNNNSGYEDPLSGSNSFKSLSGLSSPYTPSPTTTGSRRRGRGRKAGNNGDRMPSSEQIDMKLNDGGSNNSGGNSIFPDINGIFGATNSGRKPRGAGIILYKNYY